MTRFISRCISLLFSEETRASALEERIDEISEDSSARYSRGSILSQDGSYLTEKIMDDRIGRIRSRLAA